MFAYKCYCGADGRYMNMSCGEYVWTCGKYGCLNPPKITTTDKTSAQSATMTEDKMPQCIECQDEHYILHGCCDGRECGCMAKPVLMTNCIKCNPSGSLPLGDYVADWANVVEYRLQPIRLYTVEVDNER